MRRMCGLQRRGEPGGRTALEGRPSPPKVTCGARRAESAAPIPRTRFNPSRERKGPRWRRSSTMRAARAAPTPGKRSISFADATSRSMGGSSMECEREAAPPRERPPPERRRRAAPSPGEGETRGTTRVPARRRVRAGSMAPCGVVSCRGGRGGGGSAPSLSCSGRVVVARRRRDFGDDWSPPLPTRDERRFVAARRPSCAESTRASCRATAESALEAGPPSPSPRPLALRAHRPPTPRATTRARTAWARVSEGMGAISPPPERGHHRSIAAVPE